MGLALVAPASLLFAAFSGVWQPGVEASAFGGATLVSAPSHVDVMPACGKPWSGVAFRLPAPFDASRCARAVVAVTNLSAVRMPVAMNLRDTAAKRRMILADGLLAPHGSGEIVCNLLPKSRSSQTALPGMMGYDGTGGTDERIDLRAIKAISVYRRMTDETATATFRVLGVRFEGDAGVAAGALPPEARLFPFCDRYGQYCHEDWPGKIHSDADLAAARAAEAKALAEHGASPIAEGDRFGGWAKGPQLAATGFFRTEKVAGKWWLVDPDGHLFFSHGIAGVRSGDATAVAGRERFFAWLPDAAAKDVSFQSVNLVRKYGADADGAIEAGLTRRRLKAWGINTIGNWSDRRIVRGAEIPYVDNFATRARPIKGLDLAGKRMPDVFAPEFERNLAKAADAAAERSGRDPWCIGWFVDNELSWGTAGTSLAKAILAAPEDQPARQAFVAKLSDEGLSVARALASPETLCALTAFYAERYFSLVRAAIKRRAPHRLYLGCRFCSSRENAIVLTVAARHCDVVSGNIYRHDPRAWAELPEGAEDKPYLIGEFHFGALDRGGLSAAVVPARDQRDVAACYRDYLAAARASARIVGAHWFLYRDQPLTGRKDGECYQCGFVDVADSPYPEKVEAARAVARTLYLPR